MSKHPDSHAEKDARKSVKMGFMIPAGFGLLLLLVVLVKEFGGLLVFGGVFLTLALIINGYYGYRWFKKNVFDEFGRSS